MPLLDLFSEAVSRALLEVSRAFIFARSPERGVRMICGKQRTGGQFLTQVRAAAVGLLTRHLGLSHDRTGQVLGGRDHSTITRLLTRHDEFMKGDFYRERYLGALGMLQSPARQVFLLDLARDAYAVPALRAYAEACKSERPALAADVRSIIKSLEENRADQNHGVHPADGESDVGCGVEGLCQRQGEEKLSPMLRPGYTDLPTGQSQPEVHGALPLR